MGGRKSNIKIWLKERDLKELTFLIGAVDLSFHGAGLDYISMILGGFFLG